jgi:hypothetical protein
MQTIYCKLNIETESEIMVHDARVALLTGVVETTFEIEEPSGVVARSISISREDFSLLDASVENAYILTPDALSSLRRRLGYIPSAESAINAEKRRPRPSL